MSNNPLSDDVLLELITHPAAPTARAFRARGASVAPVDQLVSFIQERTDHPDARHVETSLDSYIERQGGGRLGYIDLDRIFSRLWSRLRGRSFDTSPVMYEIPNRLFEEKGRTQTSIVGRPKR